MQIIDALIQKFIFSPHNELKVKSPSQRKKEVQLELLTFTLGLLTNNPV